MAELERAKTLRFDGPRVSRISDRYMPEGSFAGTNSYYEWQKVRNRRMLLPVISMLMISLP